jgi:hypothetical protein
MGGEVWHYTPKISELIRYDSGYDICIDSGHGSRHCGFNETKEHPAWDAP